MPRNRLIRGCYRWYFRHILPRIGQLLARNSQFAYNYLPQSVIKRWYSQNETMPLIALGEAVTDVVISADNKHAFLCQAGTMDHEHYRQKYRVPPQQLYYASLAAGPIMTNDSLLVLTERSVNRYRIHFSPDSRRVLIYNDEVKEVCLIDLTKQPIQRLYQGGFDHSYTLATSVLPDKKLRWIFAGKQRSLYVDLERGIHVDLPIVCTKAEYINQTQPRSEHTPLATNHLVTSNETQSCIKVWDIRNPRRPLLRYCTAGMAFSATNAVGVEHLSQLSDSNRQRLTQQKQVTLSNTQGTLFAPKGQHDSAASSRVARPSLDA